MPVTPPSLRRELAQTLTLVSVVWMLVVFLTMAFGVRHEVDDLMDDALQEAAEVLYGSLVLHAPHAPLAHGDTLPAPAHEERLVWQIVGTGNRVLLRSHRAPNAPMLTAARPGLNADSSNWRVYAMDLPEPGQMLLVGRAMQENREARYEAIGIIGSSGLLASLVCAIWMRQRVARALRPLRTLSAQIQAYDPTQPATDLPAPSRQEFIDVRSAVIDLGRRLKRRVDQEHAFAAHAAHTLRTPLAGLDAQLAIAIREAPVTMRPRLRRARDATARLTRVVHALVALFRSHATLRPQPVWIDKLLQQMGIDGVEVQVEQSLALPADANLLAAALGNLLDNARQSGAAHVWITVASTAGAWQLNLRDDGPGLPQEQIERIQAHVNEPIDEGFVGLGLKLAALVARAHQGRFSIRSAAPDAGISVTLHLWETGPVHTTESGATGP